MNDTERIDFLERTESTAEPLTDDRGMLVGWIASCRPLVVSIDGKSWRDSVDALVKKMEEAC